MLVAPPNHAPGERAGGRRALGAAQAVALDAAELVEEGEEEDRAGGAAVRVLPQVFVPSFREIKELLLNLFRGLRIHFVNALP